MKITDVVTEDKKDSSELTRKTARDPRIAVALRRAYSKYPTAGSDIEAYIRQEIEKGGEIDQDLDRQHKTNDRQDSYLSRLQDLTRKQSTQLKSLDDENDDQEREIHDLEQELYTLSNKPVVKTEPKKDKKIATSTTTSPAFEPTVKQQRREKNKAQKSVAPVAPAATPVQHPKPSAPKLDVLPGAKDDNEKQVNTFAPTVKALAGPSDPFSRMAQELQPRQKELPLDEPVRFKRDTSKAVDAPYREITRQMAQQLATNPDLKSQLYDPDAARAVVGQKELELAEQLKTLAGIK